VQEPVPNISEDLLDPRSTKKISQRWWNWLSQLSPPTTFSGTIVTAKLTGGGANGSMTFVNGVLTSQVAAT